MNASSKRLELDENRRAALETMRLAGRKGEEIKLAVAVAVPGQLDPAGPSVRQWIELSRAGEVRCASWFGDGESPDAWHGRSTRLLELPDDVAAAPDERAYLETLEAQTLLVTLIEGRSEHYDGSSTVGRLSPAAEDALFELREALENLDEPPTYWAARDWMQDIEAAQEFLESTECIEDAAEAALVAAREDDVYLDRGDVIEALTIWAEEIAGRLSLDDIEAALKAAGLTYTESEAGVPAFELDDHDLVIYLQDEDTADEGWAYRADGESGGIDDLAELASLLKWACAPKEEEEDEDDDDE